MMFVSHFVGEGWADPYPGVFRVQGVLCFAQDVNVGAPWELQVSGKPPLSLEGKE